MKRVAHTHTTLDHQERWYGSATGKNGQTGAHVSDRRLGGSVQGLSLRWRRLFWGAWEGNFSPFACSAPAKAKPDSHSQPGRAVRPLRCQQKWPRTSTEHTAPRARAGISCRFYGFILPRTATDGRTVLLLGPGRRWKRGNSKALFMPCSTTYVVLLHYNGPPLIHVAMCVDG